MALSAIIDSLPGACVVQSFFHSLMAAAVAEIAVKSFGIRNPRSRQRLFLAIIVAPVVTVPVYLLAVPYRDSVPFRTAALFDSGRWLFLETLGFLPVVAVLVIAFLVASLSFVFQELAPILSQTLRPSRPDRAARDGSGDPAVREALAPLGGDAPPVFIVEDDDVFIYSTTGRNASITLSSGLAATLSVDQLRAALAHEIAHVTRSRLPLLPAVFFLRIVMFFNPVVLMAFRRAVQEDERICDEMAVALTGDRAALAETLRTLYLGPEESGAGGRPRSALRLVEDMDRYSHRLNIESRITGVADGSSAAEDGGWLAFASSLAVTAALNYFIV
ncbi:MAG: M56 family metallopeptidase [Deltaproteobacteria bacterium]